MVGPSLSISYETNFTLSYYIITVIMVFGAYKSESIVYTINMSLMHYKLHTFNRFRRFDHKQLGMYVPSLLLICMHYEPSHTHRIDKFPLRNG